MKNISKFVTIHAIIVTQESEKCIQCNQNYYKLIENKAQNSNCYNEKTKSINYYLIQSDDNKYYQSCDTSCKACIDESTKYIKCNTNYYKLKEKQNENSNCYNNPTKSSNYFLFENGDIKYYDKCDISCNGCIGEGQKCIVCNTNYYKLIENKDQNSICYNEKTKPTYYYLIDSDGNKYYKSCDNSCLACLDESTKCFECNSNYYKLKENKNQNSICYNDATKKSNYFLNEVNKNF